MHRPHPYPGLVRVPMETSSVPELHRGGRGNDRCPGRYEPKGVGTPEREGGRPSRTSGQGRHLVESGRTHPIGEGGANDEVSEFTGLVWLVKG